MKKEAIIWVTILVFFLIFNLAACQRDNKYLISGKIHGGNGAFDLAGINIIISGDTCTTVKSDSDGNWEALVAGTVAVSPRKRGYGFTPDHEIINSAASLTFVADRKAEIDFARWEPLHYLGGHTHRVGAIASSPEGRYIASGSDDLTIRIWDIEKGEMVMLLAGHRRNIRALAWSPDGKYLISGCVDGSAIIWDFKSGQPLHYLDNHADYVSDFAWSPDANFVASSSWDKTVRVWATDTGEEVLILNHAGWVKGVDWSPDGRFLVSGGDDKEIRFWDAGTGKLISGIKTKDYISSLAWSSTGRYLAVGDLYGMTMIFSLDPAADLRVDEEPIILDNHNRKVNNLAWSTEGEILASAGGNGEIYFWSPSRSEQPAPIRLFSNVLSIAWILDNKTLATGSNDSRVRILSIETGEEIANISGHLGPIKDLAWSPAGDFLVSGSTDMTMRIWDMESLEERYFLSIGHPRGIEAVTWSPDGKYIASGGFDPIINLWDAEEGRIIAGLTDRIKKPLVHSGGLEFFVRTRNVSHDGMILSLDWSPDNRRLASSSWDETVGVWDTETGKQLLSIRSADGWMRSVAWSPDGQYLAAAGMDCNVNIYKGATGEKIKSFSGHTNTIRTVEWSPEGDYIATGSYDGSIRIWEVETGANIETFLGHIGIVNTVSWSPDGCYLASGSNDCSLRIWDTVVGVEVANFSLDWSCEALAWRADGKLLAGSCGTSIVLVGAGK